MNLLDSQFLNMLACPLSKATLIQRGDQLVSTDRSTRRVYQISEGLPDLLIEHSRELDINEWQRLIAHEDDR